MTEKDFETRTWCVGRYLVDMPVEFEMTFTNSGIGNTTSVEVFPLGQGTEEDLQRIVRERAAALKTGEVREGGTNRRLVYERQTGHVYVIAHEAFFPDMPEFKDSGYDAEGYFLRNEKLFRANAIIIPERESSDLSDLLQVAAATYPRANDEIPDGEGFCVDGAFVKLPVVDELVRVLFKDPNAPNYFGLSLSLGDKRSASRIHKVNNWGTLGRSRQVAGQNGVEMRIISKGDQSVRFKYSGGENAKVGDPYRSIGATLFKNSQPVDAPPYGVDEMHAVWNLMLNSVRRR